MGDGLQRRAVLSSEQAEAAQAGECGRHEGVAGAHRVGDVDGERFAFAEAAASQGHRSGGATGDCHQRRAQLQPGLHSFGVAAFGVEQLEVFRGGLDDVGAGYELLDLLARPLAVGNQGGPVVGVIGDGGFGPGPIQHSLDRFRPRLDDGTQRAGMQMQQRLLDGDVIVLLRQLAELVLQLIGLRQLPVQGELVACLAGGVQRGGRHRGRQLICGEQAVDTLGLEIAGNHAPVVVVAAAAGEDHLMLQPSQPHRHIERTAADVRFGSRRLRLDNVYQAFANDC